MAAADITAQVTSSSVLDPDTVEILAIPPRKDPGNVCSKWRFSMRTPDDPEYVKDPSELASKRDRD